PSSGSVAPGTPESSATSSGTPSSASSRREYAPGGDSRSPRLMRSRPRQQPEVSLYQEPTTSAPQEPQAATARVRRALADHLRGRASMDVVTPEQARIAEDAGAVAVMALERVPADIRAEGGVSRMSDPDMIDGIIAAVSIPVMTKARIGHFVE